MDQFERDFRVKVVQYRWWVILASVFLVAWAGSGGQYLTFTSDYRIYFDESNPQLMAFESMENTYTKNDNVLIVLTPKSGDVFTPRMLGLVENITKQAWQVPYSSRVDSITNFQYTAAQGDDGLIVRDLVQGGADFSAEQLIATRNIAFNEPVLMGNLLSPSGDVTAINITINLPGIDETHEVPQVVEVVRAMAAEIERDYPDVAVHMTGMVIMDNAFSETAQMDMATLLPLSFLVMVVVLGLLLRGYAGTLVTIVVIVFTIIAAMGLGGHVGMPLTPSIMSAPIILLTVVVANSVHILVSFYEELRAGRDKLAAIDESLRINLQPIILTSITTAIGFLTMNFSEVPPFQHLGNLVATGVIVALMLSIFFLPAALAVLPIRIPKQQHDRNRHIAQFADWVVMQRKKLLIVMVVCVVGLSLFISKNELNDNFVQYFDERIEFRTDTDYVTDRLTGLYSFSYSLGSGEEGGISRPAFLADVDAFKQWLEQQPEVLHVNAITTVFKRLNQNMNGDDPAAYHLPTSRELAAQYLLLYEMSLPYGIDLNDRINVAKSATRLSAQFKTLTTQQTLDLEQRSLAWLKNNAKHIVDVSVASPGLMFAHISQRNVISMLTGTTLALVIISLILIFALRSLKIGLISMVPNLVPAAMAFGVWGVAVGEVGLALSVVMGMTLGIVVDDTVHFLSKYLRARREKGLCAEDAVRYAFRSVGRALVFTSIVLTIGFLILATSSFELNSSMGMLSAIVIIMALATDFLLLPALLIKSETQRCKSQL